MKPESRKSDDAGLKRLESLYEQAANVEPDTQLDRAVLDRARRAAPRSGWIGPWSYGLAGALCLVLVVGVAVRQGVQYRVPVELYEEVATEEAKDHADAPRSAAPVQEPIRVSGSRMTTEPPRAEAEASAADAFSRLAVPDIAVDDMFDPVRALLDEGREAEARQLLDTLREAHPYARIPADLEERLGIAARTEEP